MSDEIARLEATASAEAVRNGQVSPRELVNAVDHLHLALVGEEFRDVSREATRSPPYFGPLETWLDDSADGGESGELPVVPGPEDSSRSVVDAHRDASDRAPEIAVPDVARLFGGLAVERTASGRLRIEAPPEAAEALASLFEGFAETLRRAAR
jgi:hypothetical protein